MKLQFGTIDLLLSKVDLGLGVSHIDLSEVDFIDQFALVYLGMFMRAQNQQGRQFHVQPPRNRRVIDYLMRLGFDEKFRFNLQGHAAAHPGGATTSWYEMLTIQRSHTAADDIMQQTLDLLNSASVRLDRFRVAELVAELVDNFALHSDRDEALCTMQYYPKLHLLSFAVGDCGIGIRQSLSSNPRYSMLAGQPHRAAIIKAFEPLVSRRREGGTGLTTVAESVEQSGGRLHLTSGNAWARIDQRGRRAGTLALELSGVQVEVSFPERG